MGKVESFTISGLQLWFNSSDHHPPHFHAKKKGAWEIRVFIKTTNEKDLDFNVKFSFGKKKPTSSEKKKLAELVSKHKDKLLEDWEKKVDVKENME
ncbi:MAG: DUF4160 domain-containing protein [Cyanobacteria bacterium SBLK]|nr:DUF4160 domain-containing protein [Cyanobacteria bacterium SBLK]